MFDGSPRSEDMQSGKTTSMSSPSIKSESDVHSPGQPPINSPMSISAMTAGLVDDYDGSSMQLGSLGAIDDPAWPYVDEDLEVSLIRDKILMTYSLISVFVYRLPTCLTFYEKWWIWVVLRQQLLRLEPVVVIREIASRIASTSRDL